MNDDLEDEHFDEDLPDDGGEAIAFEIGSLRVERQQGCYRLLTWRCLPGREVGPSEVDSVRELLVGGAYGDRSRHPNLIELERDDRHRIVIVRTTGRMQIRIDYEVHEAERESAARSVSADLAAALAYLDL